MKNAIRFLKKIVNTVLSKLRTFAWRKLIPWCIFFCASLLIISASVCQKTKPRITTVEELTASGEHFDLILVLGCAVRADGTLSHMLEDRVKTGVSLYRADLADGVLMSGDRSEGYDEVGAMEREAEKLGVPQERILIDPEGYSTYESIANLAKVHKGKRVLIVTQKYHLHRALYIAEKLGVDAYGAKYDLREILARVKDVFWVEYQLK